MEKELLDPKFLYQNLFLEFLPTTCALAQIAPQHRTMVE